MQPSEQRAMTFPADVQANASTVDLFTAWSRHMQRREYEAARECLAHIERMGRGRL